MKRISFLKQALPLAGAALLLAAPTLSTAQNNPPLTASVSCKVFDADLQASYEGGCKDGLAEGRGVARGPGGVYYNGEFRAGTKTGQGRKVYSNGDVYNGGWLHDLREGRGSYVHGELSPWRGDRYEGEWAGDRRHGNGTYIFAPDNVRFETQFFAGGPLADPPPSIVQRKRAVEVLTPVIGKPGVKVCSVTTQGASPKNIARGVVAQAWEDRIQVRIDTPRVFDLSMSKANPRWDIITDWGPC